MGTHHLIDLLVLVSSASYLPPESDHLIAHTLRHHMEPCHHFAAAAQPRVCCWHLEPSRVWLLSPSASSQSHGSSKRQQHSRARLQSPPQRGTGSEWKHMDLRGVGVCLFLNCIKPFPCLESATFFKASEHGARLQFAFPRSPAFREPENNEPPSPRTTSPPACERQKENKQPPSSEPFNMP